jgi:hypothetical protein
VTFGLAAPPRRLFICLPFFAATFLFQTGCSSPGYPYVAQKPPPSAYHPVQSPLPLSKSVEIISEPAGARIEIDDDYIGDAPLVVGIPQTDGYFKKQTVIRAIPTEAGDYVQTKLFQGTGADASYGSKIPSRILFDMRLGPSTPGLFQAIDRKPGSFFRKARRGSNQSAIG